MSPSPSWIARSLLASLVVIGGGGTSGCGAEPEATEAPPGTAWLSGGDTDARFRTVARHLRGFDVAMAETGYRYTELYWAGADRNWGYADYQLGKIETAIANGLERRPRRAASARMIDAPIAQTRSAIEARDAAAFDRAFEQLTATCNGCHRAEDVAFIRVVPPVTRLSAVRGAAAGPSEPTP